MKLSRRKFLEIACATGSAGLAGLPARAHGAGAVPGEEETAVLVDATLCIGCRGCEAACAEANHLPDPPPEPGPAQRSTSQTAFTVVNRFEQPGDPGHPRYVKTQCLHCVAPACASACPVRALDKLPSGPVVYHQDRCMGCRYCMVACPFGVPKYEYEKAAPFVRKCTFCAERQAQGKLPACVSVCPSGALTFGKRGELLDLAKRRIYQAPDRYVHHVFGEHEAGGTNWMYVADVRFERLAMNTDVLDRPYPDLVRGALGVPPLVMTLWPPLLMGLYAFSQRRREVEATPSPSSDGSGHE